MFKTFILGRSVRTSRSFVCSNDPNNGTAIATKPVVLLRLGLPLRRWRLTPSDVRGPILISCVIAQPCASRARVAPLCAAAAGRG